MVPLPRDRELVIGRDSSCQLSLPEPTLSRFHARFVGGAATVKVEDLGSRNGTWFAGKRIESAVLCLGASVLLADIVVTATFGSWSPLGEHDPSAFVPEALYLSEPMREVQALLHRVARTDLAVMIQGETGTGKELAARELHAASDRGRGPFRVLNCAAIPPTLVESTLFGHERGAFTGAERARAGIFEMADGGTLFLDEVGELPLTAQAALLRVLESRCLTRVGASREILVDVRVVSATNRDLQAMVAHRAFRSDLFHRLCVVSLELPPLRHRREEIATLAQHFLSLAQSSAQIEQRALARLQEYHWPGNVRELRNAVARAAALAHGFCIMEGDLPEAIRSHRRQRIPAPPPESDRSGAATPWRTLRTRLSSLERAEAQRALAQTNGHQRRAAELLGISLRTFERRLQAWRAETGAALARGDQYKKETVVPQPVGPSMTRE